MLQLHACNVPDLDDVSQKTDTRESGKLVVSRNVYVNERPHEHYNERRGKYFWNQNLTTIDFSTSTDLDILKQRQQRHHPYNLWDREV